MQVVALEPHTEVLRCHNWLGTAQRFQVAIAMQPPTAALRLTGVRQQQGRQRNFWPSRLAISLQTRPCAKSKKCTFTSLQGSECA